jgi:DNA-binding transcriptional ArsR family regulator
MPRRVRSITEPQDLRALAHPLRLRLLGALRLDGPATASDLARRLGVSSGLTSYHLRALAERGFVEDDPEQGGGGRERWWRAAHDAHEWASGTGASDGDDAERAGRIEATRALNVEAARFYGRWLEQSVAAEPDLDEHWQRASNSFDRWLRLSPRRLAQLHADVEALVDRYEAEPEDDGAERVGILFAGLRSDGVVE